MADQAISELIAAKQITATDLFVLEQNGTAKKLTGQILLNWLTAAADGHGGIQSISKLSTSGLADTYRITLADTTVFDFVVTNGRSVSSIVKTSTVGLEDTYTITYNDATTTTFTVTNGEKGKQGDNTYTWIKYASQEPTADSHSFGDLPDDWIGIYAGTLAEAPDDWQQYTWFRIRGETGETGAPAVLVSASVTYQAGDSGTIIPSGTWTDSIPVVAQGKYLWTKILQQFNTGDPVTAYTISRMGLDGLGSVVSVCGISPDEGGNVPLDAASVKALSINGGGMAGPINMNGQKLNGLNAPTEDAEAATKGYTLGLVRKAAARNWLDNSDFANPVNQRGITSQTGAKYGIDRWTGHTSASTMTVADGHMEFSSTASGQSRQYIDTDKKTKLLGKTVTLACKYTNGNVFLASGTVPAQTPDSTTTVCNVAVGSTGAFIRLIFNADGTFYVQVFTPQITISLLWVALYEGEYTADTLPDYRPKGYGAELLECQRYYQIRSTNNIAATDLRPLMRLAIPTITEVDGGYAYSADL